MRKEAEAKTATPDLGRPKWEVPRQEDQNGEQPRQGDQNGELPKDLPGLYFSATKSAGECVPMPQYPTLGKRYLHHNFECFDMMGGLGSSSTTFGEIGLPGANVEGLLIPDWGYRIRM